MRRPQGYGVIYDPLPRAGQAGVREYDTITCGHCGKVVHVKPGAGSTVYLIPCWTLDNEKKRQPSWKEESGAMCRLCMRAVCLPCHHVGACTPIEKWLAETEQAGKLMRALQE